MRDETSDGKTTVLRYVQSQLGGSLVGMREFLRKLAAYGPISLEEIVRLLDSGGHGIGNAALA